MRKFTEKDLKKINRRIRAGERIETYEPKNEKYKELYKAENEIKSSLRWSVFSLVVSIIALFANLIILYIRLFG